MNKEANTTVFHLHKEENIPEGLLIICLKSKRTFSSQRVYSVSSLSQTSFRIASISCRCGKKGKCSHNKPICSCFHCDMSFHLAGLLSCPWQANTCQAVQMWWSQQAMWGKAVCMLGSPGDFTKACTTLFASSDSAAFRADKTMEADSQRAFCSFQLLWKKGRILAKMLKQSRSRVQLHFFFFTERKYCCSAESERICWKTKTALTQSILHWGHRPS